MKKIYIVFLLLVISTSVIANEERGDSKDIKPIAMAVVKIGSVQYEDICRSIKDKCNKNGDYSIWKSKGEKSTFYFINRPLELVKIKKINNNYHVDGDWSFSKYHHSNENKNRSDDDLSSDGVTIYPVIYPLSKEKQAIALVYKWSASYSGGGREYNYADFIMLSNDAKYSVAFKNILFSSKEQVRACFTEEDYSKKSHCYDENWSILNIKFIDDNKEYYSWGFINKSYDWPSFTDKSVAKMKITQDIKYPFQEGRE